MHSFLSILTLLLCVALDASCDDVDRVDLAVCFASLWRSALNVLREIDPEPHLGGGSAEKDGRYERSFLLVRW